MTVSSIQTRSLYIGNGTSTEFDFTFPYQNPEDVKVVVLTTGDTETPLAYVTDYAISQPGDGPGGRVSLGSPLTNGHKLTIYRDPVPLQQIDFEENQRYYLETTEQGFDFAIMIAQRHRELFDRSLVLRESDVNGAGRYDAKANRIANLAAAVNASDAVTLAQVQALVGTGGGGGSGGGGTVVITPEQLQQITDTVLQSTALSGLFDPINTQIGNLSTTILALDGEIGSLDLTITSLQSQIGTINVSVAGIDTRLTATEATVATLAAISGDAGALVALVTAETTARIAGDAAIATTISKIGALSGDGLSFIINVDTAKISSTESLAQKFSGITATFTATDAAIAAGDAANAATIAAGDNANAVAIAAASAAITAESTARANADTSLASQITTLQSNFGSLTTSLQVTSTVVDGISAKYTVKIDNNGYVSGYGLISAANNGVPVSQFTVLADRFAVVLPGQTPRVPFIAGNLNGTPGVGINGTLIVDGSITANSLQARSVTADRIVAGSLTAAELANLAVTGAKIADATITGAKIVAGSIAANRLSVAQLSAITADLGLVTAGLMRFTSGSYRLEVGVDTGYIQWYGTGTKNDANANFWIKPDGTAFFKGIIGPGSTLPTPPAFSVSIVEGNLTGTGASGSRGYGSRTASVTGGTAPYTYAYQIVSLNSANGNPVQCYLTGTPVQNTSATTTVIGVAGNATNERIFAQVQATVTDAAGRVAVAQFGVNQLHGTLP